MFAIFGRPVRPSKKPVDVLPPQVKAGCWEVDPGYHVGVQFCNTDKKVLQN
tara:strand:+ start:104 stop:256 length:153 start_codon:yes stop_codon:yes gene_type:complete